MVSRFGIAALVSLIVSSRIALAGYSLGLWMGLPVGSSKLFHQPQGGLGLFVVVLCVPGWSMLLQEFI